MQILQTSGLCDIIGCPRSAVVIYEIFAPDGREVGIIRVCNQQHAIEAGKRAVEDFHKYIRKTQPDIEVVIGTTKLF